MQQLETVFFMDSEDIYPFIKKETENNREHYSQKAIVNQIKETSLSEEEKMRDIIELKSERYSKLLSEGYTETELLLMLDKAMERLYLRANSKGIDNTYLEKQALSLATKKRSLTRK